MASCGCVHDSADDLALSDHIFSLDEFEVFCKLFGLVCRVAAGDSTASANHSKPEEWVPDLGKKVSNVTRDDNVASRGMNLHC